MLTWLRYAHRLHATLLSTATACRAPLALAVGPPENPCPRGPAAAKRPTFAQRARAVIIDDRAHRRGRRCAGGPPSAAPRGSPDRGAGTEARAPPRGAALAEGSTS